MANHDHLRFILFLFPDPPEIDSTKSSLPQMTVSQGETANLICMPDGDPEPSVEWYKYNVDGTKQSKEILLEGCHVMLTV